MKDEVEKDPELDKLVRITLAILRADKKKKESKEEETCAD